MDADVSVVRDGLIWCLVTSVGGDGRGLCNEDSSGPTWPPYTDRSAPAGGRATFFTGSPTSGAGVMGAGSTAPRPSATEHTSARSTANVSRQDASSPPTSQPTKERTRLPEELREAFPEEDPEKIRRQEAAAGQVGFFEVAPPRRRAPRPPVSSTNAPDGSASSYADDKSGPPRAESVPDDTYAPPPRGQGVGSRRRTGPPVPPHIRERFRTLQVPTGSTADEVRRAYRKLALLHHPDKNPNVPQEHSARRFREIAAAYEAVSAYLQGRGTHGAVI